MRKIEHNDKIYRVDENGFLVDPAEWDSDWVDYVRMTEGITELNETHHSVIVALRNYYQEHGSPPMVRFFSKCTNLPLKRAYELFPSGPGEGACKMAGLPAPFYLHQIHSCR